MTTKKEETKTKNVSSSKRVLYDLVQESGIEEHKIIGALAKAGLLIQYDDEKSKHGRFDLEPSITKNEFDKIIKNFLG